MGSWHAWVLAAVVGCCLVASAWSFQLPTKSVYPFLLGETAVNISVFAAPVPTSSGAARAALHFLNVHQNENTSVVAAKVLLYFYGGSITLLEHGGERLVSFKLEGTVYTFDPNRMFTPVGVEATLKEYGPYSPVAAKHVLAFSQRLLEIYDFNRLPTVVTLHNNGPNYNASLYLPGGPFANEAEKVFIAPGAFARDFFFVTENAFFEKLKAEGLNVVLQQSQHAPTDDGSLSVYAYLKKKPYLNVEAAAADDADGTRVLAQVDMLTRMKTSVLDR